MKTENFLLVSSKVLPPVFEGVVNAKDLLSDGSAKNVSEAVKKVGISRSAFYKYRDFVFKSDSVNKKNITLSASLFDKAGVFSNMSKILSENGANIVTVNQGAPTGGLAHVTLTVCTDSCKITLDELIEQLKNADGILSVKTI